MIWFLAVLVVAVVLGTLSGLSNLTEMIWVDGAWLSSHLLNIMSMLLFGCAFLCHKFWQVGKISQGIYRICALSAGVLLLLVMAFLFVVRTLSVHTEFEKNVPKQSYTVTAQVLVHEISDSVYDNNQGTNYRQKATLHHLQLVENRHTYADTAKNIPNPFGNETTDKPIVLPSTMTVLLTAFAQNNQEFQALHELVPNTQVQMTLIISAPNQTQTASGFDGYQWLRTRHIHANARILSIDSPVKSLENTHTFSYLQKLRQTLRTHFYKNWQSLDDKNRQARAVTLSLLTGDRALIDKSTKELYQLAGMSHLLAISGTHVVFLAMILAWAVTRLLDTQTKIYQYVSRGNIYMGVMLFTSALYALFTGFDVPAVRTVYMLLAWFVVRQLALPMTDMAILLVVALVMVWLDPFVVWQAGFWLSFVAVLCLMSYDEQKLAKSSYTLSVKDTIVGLVKLQSWLFIAMLPISLLLFGKVSLWGLLVNVFAVGLFGMVIVPINLLAGVIFVFMPVIADGLWAISSFILWVLHELLVILKNLGGQVWLYDSMGMVGVLLTAMVFLVLAIPALSKKLIGIPVLAMVFVFFNHDKDKENYMNVWVLPSQDGKISQVLIQQKNADPNSVNGWANWLVIADFGASGLSNDFANHLVDMLKKQGVTHLTGVIVQTPSTSVAQTLSGINRSIPIYHYWQAGRLEGLALPVSTCQANQMWQGAGLSVQAFTGWVQIADSQVWGCSVAFDSVMMPDVHGATGLTDRLPQQTTYRMVVDGVIHERTWQLYEMLCPVQTQSADIWLTNTQSAFTSRVKHTFAPKQLLFTDKNTLETYHKSFQMAGE